MHNKEVQFVPEKAEKGTLVHTSRSEQDQATRMPDEEDRVVVYSASTPQVLGSINGLRKVDSAFHPRYIGSKNEYQACLGS
ncbi:hypothetical protein TNCV_2546781 [Trichonephila clavipes]|nr:hypothetical protein TNCV_2546781 [Trichonephila clavipes]